LEECREQGRSYYRENKDALIRYQREYQRKQRKENPVFMLRHNLRKRVRNAIKCGKAGSAVKDLGCSVGELKQRFEARFRPHPKTGEMMTWDNYGYYGWHMDHIVPLAAFDLTDREQFLKACHYTNLQPLWAEENMKKGDRIFGAGF